MASEFILRNDEIIKPTYEEFFDFTKYITSLENGPYFNSGFAHIRAPPEYVEQWDEVTSMPTNLLITPAVQSIEKQRQGFLISSSNLRPKLMTVTEYLNQVSTTEKYCESVDEYETEYWSTLTANEILYGADINYSFCRKVSTWNFNRLNSILDYVKTSSGGWVQGIHQSYDYIGSWKSSFGWHTEDSDLHSINILLSSKPKVWYIVPREDGLRFDCIVSSLYQGYSCKKFLRHKMCLFGEDFFIKNKIKRIRVVQNPGEIIITFPYIFHSGFNCGINFNEAVNFGTKKWIDYGKSAIHCSCRPTKQRPSFRIDLNLDEVVKRFQRGKFDTWKNRRSELIHPDDPLIGDGRKILKETNAKKLAENVQNRVLNAELSQQILALYARFLVDDESSSISDKGVRKFRKYARKENVKLPTLLDSTLLSRLMKQTKDCLRRKNNYLDLSRNEIRIVREKLKC